MQNVGVLDSVLRVTLGFALVFVGFIAPAPLKFWALGFALVFLITGFAGRCPLYRLLGIQTCAAVKNR
jgi:hypothetical protein